MRRDLIEQDMLRWLISTGLSLEKFRGRRMTFDWSSIYAHETAIEETKRGSVEVHYTMLYDTLKMVVAKQFGHWLDKNQNSGCS